MPDEFVSSNGQVHNDKVDAIADVLIDSNVEIEKRDDGSQDPLDWQPEDLLTGRGYRREHGKFDSRPIEPDTHAGEHAQDPAADQPQVQPPTFYSNSPILNQDQLDQYRDAILHNAKQLELARQQNLINDAQYAAGQQYLAQFHADWQYKYADSVKNDMFQQHQVQQIVNEISTGENAIPDFAQPENRQVILHQLRNWAKDEYRIPDAILDQVTNPNVIKAAYHLMNQNHQQKAKIQRLTSREMKRNRDAKNLARREHQTRNVSDVDQIADLLVKVGAA